MVQALWTKGGNMVDCCCCSVGSRITQHTCIPIGTAGIITAPFALTWHQDLTLPLGSYGCLPGTHYSVVLSFNTALRWHHMRDEGCTSHNKQGRLPVDTEHSDTSPVLRSPQK
jgi:hypothetical protein